MSTAISKDILPSFAVPTLHLLHPRPTVFKFFMVQVFLLKYLLHMRPWNSGMKFKPSLVLATQLNTLVHGRGRAGKVSAIRRTGALPMNKNMAEPEALNLPIAIGIRGSLSPGDFSSSVVFEMCNGYDLGRVSSYSGRDIKGSKTEPESKISTIILGAYLNVADSLANHKSLREILHEATFLFNPTIYGNLNIAVQYEALRKRNGGDRFGHLPQPLPRTNIKAGSHEDQGADKSKVHQIKLPASRPIREDSKSHPNFH
ncbi:uncharacterized protein BDR25DRAFT_363165 [Lindgomyces ingoldianus]|uniref:Uncharacterized protein n=1 Tax=Lindgomyces ingoldianus TaxID=673940 RepID=A0ACB6Q9N6_9PLEO|nr:uncharacterized protein BDR25DRAFT_363165 [Lindgomyces ingoldianus]KAF2463077.1 hypothetical protein BDR25DRAFT_363165 [Lindgomyces ingoldianus]